MTKYPRVKITFAVPSLKSDFSEPGKECAKGGATREFEPAGERSLIIAAR